MSFGFKEFIVNDSGAISVDYTVLSAAAVATAISATVILSGGIDVITSAVDAELRERQLNDTFIEFKPVHFEPLFEFDMISEEEASDLWNAANAKMNQDLIDALQEGIIAIEEETILPEEIPELFAIASVAYQRNVIDDAILEYYFGFDDGVPMDGPQPVQTDTPNAAFADNE